MRSGTLLSVLVIAAALLPRETAATSRRRECRRACVATIDACVAAGGKRRRCRRQTLKRCRHEGPIACATSSTTTTSPEATTTSAPGGTMTTSPGGTSTTSPGITTTSAPGATTTTLPPVNGCTYAGALDRTAPGAFRIIVFTSFYYSPPCMRIAAGETASFQGSFITHPLAGGAIVDMTKMPDPASPIPYTPSGTSQDVTFPTAGVFPYYCDLHGETLGMYGAVYVDP